MNWREHWKRTMHYEGGYDRIPPIHWQCWPETLEKWQQEGHIQKEEDLRTHFKAIPHFSWVSPNLDPYPAFENKVYEETDEHIVYRQADGCIVKGKKGESSIPHFVDYTMTDASGWDKYKERLQPHPDRLPKNLENCEQSQVQQAIFTGSLMGFIRNWMGVENMSYLLYDDPEVYEDMVKTIADLTLWALDEILPKMTIKPDLGFGWEDICGSTGPFVSPHFVAQYVAPQYARIRAKLEEHGIDIYGIDSDGLIEPIVPQIMDGGINLIFPVEPGTWKASPEDLRKKFGQELRMVGGFDKMVLEKDRAAIDAEIERHIPLIKEGGYIMMPDHLITPGTSFENYSYYMEQIHNLRF